MGEEQGMGEMGERSRRSPPAPQLVSPSLPGLSDGPSSFTRRILCPLPCFLSPSLPSPSSGMPSLFACSLPRLWQSLSRRRGFEGTGKK